jgi:hypothetical protein
MKFQPNIMAEKITNIKDRILQIAENKGVAKERFFEILGFSYGNFKGKSKISAPSTDIIVEISSKFPDINIEWLITGNGTILKTPLPSNENDRDVEHLKELLEEKSKRIEALEKNIKLLEEKCNFQEEPIKKITKNAGI